MFRWNLVQRVLGILLMIFSITLLPPVLVSLVYKEQSEMPFLIAFMITLLVGFIGWLPVRTVSHNLRLQDSFIVVTTFWIILSAISALPFMLSEALLMNVTDAIFESVSGLTTTGATVIINLDLLPKSILYYRQQLQWLGGMGIVVLAVAILPMLRIGGMQLYRVETSGPIKDVKLTPRITETAKFLWILYIILTIFCALAYWLVGMPAFDAISHSFATIAIGGFSTHDASMGYFDSFQIHLVAILFMIISATNFALHFIAFRYHSLKEYIRDSEFLFYIGILTIIITLVVFYLWIKGVYSGKDALIKGTFQAVSFATTAGFTTADFINWPSFVVILLLFASFLGGCAGSTGGGIKVIRVFLLIKQGIREVRRLIHPSAQIPIRISNKVISTRIIDTVWGFFALYIISYIILYLALVATGLDLTSSFSAVTAAMNNLGPGLGQISSNYALLNQPAKWILSFGMLLGRLEIFTLLVLLNPGFWKR